MDRESDNEWNRDVRETKYAAGTYESLRIRLVISRIPMSVMAANKPWTTRGPVVARGILHQGPAF